MSSGVVLLMWRYKYVLISYSNWLLKLSKSIRPISHFPLLSSGHHHHKRDTLTWKIFLTAVLIFLKGTPPILGSQRPLIILQGSKLFDMNLVTNTVLSSELPSITRKYRRKRKRNGPSESGDNSSDEDETEAIHAQREARRLEHTAVNSLTHNTFMQF